MDYRFLGGSGLKVPVLTLGTGTFGGKGPLFSMEERVEMVREEIGPLMPGATEFEVKPFSNLLMHFAMDLGAVMIIRGLRAVSDFEYELQMALMNRRQRPEVETVFMMTGTEYSYLSSSIVKEIARLGGSVEGLVPENVGSRLRGKVGR